MPKTPPIFHFFKKFVLTQRAGGGQLQSPHIKNNLYIIPTNKYQPIPTNTPYFILKNKKSHFVCINKSKFWPGAKPFLGFAKKLTQGSNHF